MLSKKSVNFSFLPPELLWIIFSYLPPSDQQSAMCVCRSWQQVGENSTFRKVRKYCFGKVKWMKYFGDVGIEPLLPPNIYSIINSSCLFWTEKKIKKTHVLTLVPEKVNGKPYNLNYLEKLIQHPKTGYITKYAYYNDDVKKELGNRSSSSHWVLMTRDVIPESRNKGYEEQKIYLENYAKKIGIHYALPRALEATTVILTHYTKTGKRIYGDDPFTYTRCQERVSKNQWPVAIGGFSSKEVKFSYGGISSSGIRIDCGGRSFSGIGCLQKF